MCHRDRACRNSKQCSSADRPTFLSGELFSGQRSENRPVCSDLGTAPKIQRATLDPAAQNLSGPSAGGRKVRVCRSLVRPFPFSFRAG